MPKTMFVRIVLESFEFGVATESALRILQALIIRILPAVVILCAIAHIYEVCTKWWTGVYIDRFAVDRKEGVAYRSSKDESAEIQERVAFKEEVDGYKENGNWVRVVRKSPFERKRYLPITLNGKRVLTNLKELQEKKLKLKKLEADLISQPMPAEKIRSLYEKVEEIKKMREDADAADAAARSSTNSWPVSSWASSAIRSLLRTDSGRVVQRTDSGRVVQVEKLKIPSDPLQRIEVEKPTVKGPRVEEPKAQEAKLEEPRADNATIAEIKSRSAPSTFLVDNTTLKSSDIGVGYRCSTNLHDKREGVHAKWGTTVTGTDNGRGWVETEHGFLPKVVHGSRVLVLQDPSSSSSTETYFASAVQHLEAEALEDGQHVHVTSDEETYERECAACRLTISDDLDAKLGQTGTILTLHKDDCTAKVDNHIGWVPIKCLTRAQMAPKASQQAHPADRVDNQHVYRIDNSKLRADTDGLGLRHSKNLDDKDPEKYVAWGQRVPGVQEDDHWLRIKTPFGEFFIPIFADGVRVVVKCDPDEARYLVDNSELQATTNGLAYRHRKAFDAKVQGGEEMAPWDSFVFGVEEDTEWLRVSGADRQLFLPLHAQNIRVLKRVDEDSHGAPRLQQAKTRGSLPRCFSFPWPWVHQMATQPLEPDADSPMTTKVICRSCRNTGIDFMGKPCSCSFGKVTNVIRPLQDSSALQAEGEIEAEGAVAEANPSYVVDGRELFPDGTPLHKGLCIRSAKSLEAESATEETVTWGECISGVDEGDGWIRLGNSRFLPTHMNQKRVLFLKESGGISNSTELPSL